MLFYIGVQLIYNVVLVSGVQQSDLVIHTHISILFGDSISHIGYYKVLSRVPCAIQQVLVDYLFYIQWCVYVNPNFLSVQFNRIKNIHIVVQPISRTPFILQSPELSSSFHLTKNCNSILIKRQLPFLPCPQPLAPTVLLSLSMNLTTLGTSYKWNHTVFSLQSLAYFIQHNVFKVHPCCSMDLPPFKG